MAKPNPAVAFENSLGINTKLNLINWTPHDINIMVKGENNIKLLTIKASGYVARLESEKIAGNKLNINSIDVPVVCKPKFTGFTETPPQVGIMQTGINVIKNVIVSMPVAEYLYKLFVDSDISNRKFYENIFVPDSGPESAVRDEKGQIIGVTGLIQYI